MLTFSTSLAENGVNFIDKDGCGLMVARQVKEHFYELLAIATPLADNCGSTDVEEGSPALSRHGLRQHGLTCAWWTEQ